MQIFLSLKIRTVCFENTICAHDVSLSRLFKISRSSVESPTVPRKSDGLVSSEGNITGPTRCESGMLLVIVCRTELDHRGDDESLNLGSSFEIVLD